MSIVTYRSILRIPYLISVCACAVTYRSMYICRNLSYTLQPRNLATSLITILTILNLELELGHRVNARVGVGVWINR